MMCLNSFKECIDIASAETNEQLIVRELTEKRISELSKSLTEIRAEYL